MIQSGVLRQLYDFLKEAGYEWQPQSPDRLLQMRKNADAHRPLVQFFGLGEEVSVESLISEGLSAPFLDILSKEKFIITSNGNLISLFSISRSGDVFVPHDHWPPRAGQEKEYVHFAAESNWLCRQIQRDLQWFVGKDVLDLGCSSGGLALEAAGVANSVLGIDISDRAIQLAQVNAIALGIKNTGFIQAAIGEASAEKAAQKKKWDIAISNPPMVVPARDANYPHRDGGKLGIELPLQFFEFASRHLKEDGKILTFATNPIVRGKGLLFEELKKTKWKVSEKECLHSHFNQNVSRKQGYDEMGIDRIELWYLCLTR